MTYEAAAFDPDYFRETRPQWSGVGDEECRRAWMEELGGAVPGTARSHLASLRLALSDYPAAFPWRFYGRRRPSVGAHRWAALDDFVNRGFALDPDLPYGPDATPFLVALARSYAGRLDRLAITAFELAAAHGPLASEEAQHLADSYLREGLWSPAREIYRRLFRDGAGTNWTVRNLLRASLPLGDGDGVADVLASTQAEMKDDDVWKGTVDALVDWVFERQLRIARAHYAADERAAGDEAVAVGVTRTAELIQRLAMPVATPHTPTRVLMVANFDDPSARRYRIDARAALLERIGEPLALLSMGDLSTFHEQLAAAKAVVFFNAPATVGLLKALLAARALGIPTVYESDASIFDPECTPPAIERYGGFIAPALHGELTLAVILYREFAKRCDVGFAATRGIADRLARIVVRGSVHVVSPGPIAPQASPPSLAPVRPLPQVFLFLRSTRFICLDGESGTVGAAILDLLQRRGDVGFVTAGHVWLAEAFNAFGDRVIELGASNDAEAYRDALAAARINVAVAPAQGDDGMIELSWLEAAELGVPTAVSAQVGPSLGLVDGVTALLVDGADWDRTFDQAIDQPAEVRAIGLAAQVRARTDHSIDRLADQLSSALHAVLEEKALP